MRILLTGATGFLGSHVARALVAAGHSVRALARPTASRALLNDVPELQWVTGDVLDSPSLTAALWDREAVVHVAAVVAFSPGAADKQRAVNVEGTRRLLEVAKAAGVQRFVQTSSVSAVGRAPEGTVADEDTRYDWPPGLAYNETKRDSERLVQRTEGMTTICLNPTLVFGPGDVFKRTLPLFRMVKWGLLPLVPPGGTTLCDVRDVAEAHVAALTKGESGARYILGGPHVTFRQLATALAEVTGGARPLAELPAGLIRAVEVPLAALSRAGVPMPISVGNLEYLTGHGYYSSAKAEAALDYRTRPAAETLADAARWYGTQGLL